MQTHSDLSFSPGACCRQNTPSNNNYHVPFTNRKVPPPHKFKKSLLPTRSIGSWESGGQHDTTAVEVASKPQPATHTRVFLGVTPSMQGKSRMSGSQSHFAKSLRLVLPLCPCTFRLYATNRLCNAPVRFLNDCGSPDAGQVPRRAAGQALPLVWQLYDVGTMH